jgi:7,8-dihydropterin-6-yl-methyl-4-(beta-D-ribofuranosyl)aminobenzene 5'-phosphate synthase
MMKIAVVYDNRTLDPDLSPAWGFSCLVGDDLLFDTGGDGPRLLSNMERMGLDVGRIKSVVLSHAHGDHTGGLAGLLAVNKEITIYLPRSFPTRFKEQVKAHTHVVEVHEPMEIAEGVYTTGEMRRGLVEQALVLVTNQGPSASSGRGLVVVTGCAHPSIVRMVERAKEVVNEEVYLVMGGFHLSVVRKKAVEGVIADFRRLGVQKVAPCHCTGKQAMGMLAAEYGDDFIEIGVGKILEIGYNTTTDSE